MTGILTNEEIVKLADYYHSRECSVSHMDQCGWQHENSPEYQGKKWAHEHWASRVPELLASDRERVAETDKLLDTLFGGWLVYSYDYNAYPIAIFKTRPEANEYVANNSHYSAYVKFWEFGTTWDFLNTGTESNPT